MFVIWGMRVLNAVLGTGQFHCPQCGVDAEYRRVQPRQWFTFFFVPVIPLRRLEPHVECTRCGTAFRDAVLGEPTTQLFEHQVGLANRAAVAHLVAVSGAAGPALRDLAVALLATSAGVSPAYDHAALAQDVAAFADPDVTLAYLRPLAHTMTTEGREEFLRRVLTFADRHDRTADRSALVAGYAAAVGLSAAHAVGIAATARRADDPQPGGAA
ncbi:zinc ribbon domain-containing protein [Cellulomonas sp. NS3]|uniref:zinc ribbon domain-containing protein n=1 Tax=Cellulomonas sp. NS3 TaxID=2973977 RepID=UPI0021631685|nr:zinc ribbon domain-containing protein [Cellulomonas sp. NS3]